MSDVVSLNELKVKRSNDCRDWSPIDCLRAVLRDLESGKLKTPKILVITMSVPDEVEGQSYSETFYAGGLYLEILGLLEETKIDMVMDQDGRDS